MLNDIDEVNYNIKKEIANRIKSIRKSKCDITGQRVADHLNVSRVTYTNIENAKQHVNAITLWKLSILFNCDVEEFFPEKPKGDEYALSKSSIKQLNKVDPRSVLWAKALFKSNI